MATMSGASRGPGSRRTLGPGLIAFLVLDVILVGVLVALLVTTLGGDDEQAAVPPAVEPESSPQETAPQDAQEAGEVRAFVLPSGNIHCEMSEASARCTILELSYERPPAPEGCAGTVGNVLSVEAGQPPTFPCVEGDVPPPQPDAPVLEYGEQSTVGEMTCFSSTNGALCRHNPSGTGFSVARAGYQLLG